MSAVRRLYGSMRALEFTELISRVQPESTEKPAFTDSVPAADPRRARTFIVDYGRGNLFGLVRAFEQLGESPIVTDDPEKLRQAGRIVLPGVGAFGDAMAELQRRRLIDVLIDAGHGGTPVLGICVGCQVLLSSGDEHGSHAGLDLIAGRACRLHEANDRTTSARVPNVGWRTITPSHLSSAVDHLAANDMVYFAHSYAPDGCDADVVAASLSFNGRQVPAALQQGVVVGVQFHPERSGPVGLSVLERFLRLQPKTGWT